MNKFFWSGLKLMLCTLVISLLACTVATKPFPTSGAEHPFYKTVENVNIDPNSNGESSPAPQPDFAEATSVKYYNVVARLDDSEVSIELIATPEVSPTALKYLEKTLMAFQVDIKKRPDLEPFLSTPGKLMKGEPEVRLPQLYGQNGNALFIAWPDGWDMVRPYIIRLRPNYAPMTPPKENEGEIGVTTQPLLGIWNTIQGVIKSQAPNRTEHGLGFAQVTINGTSVVTDASGAFSMTGSFTNVDRLTVKYEGRVTPVPGRTVGPPISVMDDFHNPRSETVAVSVGTTTNGTLKLAPVVLSSLDAELFEIGADVLQAFHLLTGRFPPAALGFRIKRWEGVVTGGPYSFFDYVCISKNFRDDYGSRESRINTILHEFGHTVRHAADGGMGHWNWDNFRWVYARNHDGSEVANEQYAFNEGWANYWECTSGIFVQGCTYPLPQDPGPTFLDWNEKQVAKRLYELSQAPGVGHEGMVEILRNNPGTIHSLIEFEQRYCATFPNTQFCANNRPKRVKPSCPPNYIDDGATCRLDNIRAKDSYGRGVGTIPNGCGSAENNAGLCYQPCPAGFDGVGPVCWKKCPPGMHDDGAFCRRDVQFANADNSSCPWYDLCGLTFARGCTTCPTGFLNDGCICRIDAWIFAKESHGRGVGTIPTDCGPGRVYDAGLCYDPCRNGFTGVGPVCWGTCPKGYADHGATCYRPPHVIVKY